jgi:membrane protein YdbS with pleckstrin-like domain
MAAAIPPDQAMTLIACKECGKQVSTLAAFCPNCGAPPRGAAVAAPAPVAAVQGGAAAAVDEDRLLWSATPSQRENAGTILGCLLIALCGPAAPLVLHHFGQTFPYEWALAIALPALAVVLWLIGFVRLKQFQYALSTRRLTIKQGLISTSIDDIALWRIKDVDVRQSLWERLGGVGSIVIVSTDAVEPVAVLHGVRDPRGVQRQLRNQIDRCRQGDGVRAIIS